MALDAFATAEPDAVPLESIARAAGVGIGTLYRHFPSRAALVEAVYRAELERLCGEADELLASMPPDRALRRWMTRYADFVSTKRGMAEALREVIASGAINSADTRAHLTTAIDTMLRAGVRAGRLRRGLRADDVCTLLVNVVLADREPEQRARTERLLDVVHRGLVRPPAAR